MNIVLASTFTSGTGTGENDLYPVGVSFYQNLGSAAGVSESMILGSGLVVSGSVEVYEERMDFDVVPGYFYLGDREFYAYNDKQTQVSHAIMSGSVNVITLLQYPDGPGPAYYDDVFNAHYEPPTPIRSGAAPLIIHYYPSGTLEALGVPLDTVISSETGISGELGYRMYEDGITGSGIVISGEVENFPWYFTPLERFVKCYEYWYSGELVGEGQILPVDLYSYDFDTNTIEIFHSGFVDYEYVVEFEGNNSAFHTGIDFSPLVTRPKDTIVCLSPTPILSGDVVDSFSIYVPKTRVYNETVSIAIDAFAEDGNRVAYADVTVSINRPYMVATSELGTLIGEPFYYGSGYCVDMVVLPEEEIYEDGGLIANTHRIDGYAYIPGAGYLSTVRSGDVPALGYQVVARTDEYGTAHVRYTAPSGIISSRDIEVVVSAGTAEGTTSIVLVSELDNCYLPYENYEVNDWVFVSGTVSLDGLAYVPAIEGCTMLSSMEAAAASGFVASLGSDTAPDMAHPVSMITISGVPYVGFDLDEPGMPLVVKYPKELNITRLDGRSTYA